jgi:hypothetical protein
MSTSTEAVKTLEQATTNTQAAIAIIDNLIVTHDYQDVASLVANAAAALLQSATLLMQSKDEDAIDALERADDFLDAVYDILDEDTSDD